MSSDLILQLKACAVKLQEAAEKLQVRVKQQKNKNKHYASIISEARFNLGRSWVRKELGLGLGKVGKNESWDDIELRLEGHCLYIRLTWQRR